ncbi:MAG TPA: hypothetical protein VIH59_20950 [Candidatus Tectomicrobia bacterium]|jgi:hypothetical protein
MNVQRVVRVVVLTMLMLTPVFATAQQMGPGREMGMHGGMGAESGAMRQMQGMIHQMGGMLAHMVDRIEAGPVTPDETKQMGEMLGQMADMMNKLSGMMSGSMTGPSGQSGGMMGSDMLQQMLGMLERMTEMHKRMMGLGTMAAPQPIPQAAPRQEKK